MSSEACGPQQSTSRFRPSAVRRPRERSVLCSFFGSATVFSSAELAGVYGTKSHYLAAYTTSLNKAIANGYILSADRAALLAQADQVQISQ